MYADPRKYSGIHSEQFSQAESTMHFYFILPMTELSIFLFVSLPGSAPEHAGRVVLLQSQGHSSILLLGLDPESPLEHAEP